MSKLLTVCMLFTVGLAVPGGAQAMPDTSHSPIDRWLDVPVHINLDAGERRKIDSLRISFAKESATSDASAKTAEARMSAVSQTHERILRFQRIVRDLLTPDQQHVFDRNLATAPPAAPRP